MADQPQPLDIQLIRRKRTGEDKQAEAPPPAPDEAQAHPASAVARMVKAAPVEAPAPVADVGMTMKVRETPQLAAVHVRIPEQLARGLRLMSVLEGRQAQVLVAEMLEEQLNKWNPSWRSSVPPR